MAFAETVDTNVNKVDGEINTHVVTSAIRALQIRWAKVAVINSVPVQVLKVMVLPMEHRLKNRHKAVAVLMPGDTMLGLRLIRLCRHKLLVEI